MNIMKMLTPKSSTAYLYDDYTIRQALEKMRHHGYRVIPVINREGQYVGTVSEGDFLWHIIDKGIYSVQSQEEHMLCDMPRSECNPAVLHSETVNELMARAKLHNFVPVTDDRGCYIGIVTRRDILNYFADGEAEAELDDENIK